jgi:hypothetical protein
VQQVMLKAKVSCKDFSFCIQDTIEGVDGLGYAAEL